MPHFYPDQRFLRRKGKVPAQVGAANPGSVTITAVFVLKFTADDVNLFSAKVTVILEALALGPAHQRYLLTTMLV